MSRKVRRDAARSSKVEIDAPEPVNSTRICTNLLENRSYGGGFPEAALHPAKVAGATTDIRLNARQPGLIRLEGVRDEDRQYRPDLGDGPRQPRHPPPCG